MARAKQKRVARKLIENLSLDKPLTGGEIVASSGYGPSMRKNPKVVIESAGVKEELKALGFDEETAKQVVGKILQTGENDGVKLKAADMVFKVHGTYSAEKHEVVGKVETSSEVVELAAKAAQLLREKKRK